MTGECMQVQPKTQRQARSNTTRYAHCGRPPHRPVMAAPPDVKETRAADTRITEANPLGKVPRLVMERAEVRTWEALADGVITAAPT